MCSLLQQFKLYPGHFEGTEYVDQDLIMVMYEYNLYPDTKYHFDNNLDCPELSDFQIIEI